MMTFACHDKLNDSSKGSVYVLLEIVLTSIFVIGVRSLYYSSLSVPFFWCGYLSISFLTILNIVSNSSINQKLLGIVLYSLSLHLFIPFVQPVGIVWDYDAIYTSQAVRQIMEQKTWVPGVGTGAARNFYSNYPILPLLEVCLSYVTSIDVSFIQQYLMLFFSPLFLTGIFLFMRKATGNLDLAILSTFLYATNPLIETLTTYVAYQGFAYVFVPFVLLFFSGRWRKSAYLFVIFSITLALTHHWSSYNLIAFLVVVTIFLYISKRKSVNFSMPTRYQSIMFLVVVVASWQIFVATFTIGRNVGVLSGLFQGLLQLHTAIEGEFTHSFVRAEGLFIESFFNYVGLATFVCMGLIGGITSLKNKQKLEEYLFVFGIGISFINYFVFPWHLFQFPPGMRNRLLDYAYLYTVPAAIIGAYQLRRFLSRRIGKNGIYILSLLFLLLTPSTIITSFDRHYFTFSPQEERKGYPLIHVNSTQWMEASQWVTVFVPPKIRILGDGSAKNYIGGLATREVDVMHLLDFLDDVKLGPLDQGNLVVFRYKILELGGDKYFDFTAEDLNKIQAHLNLVYTNQYIYLYCN